MSDSVRMTTATIFAIRDAHGLTAHEKLFLFVVESRGELYTSIHRTARDMGISETTLNKVIRSLKTKGLLRVQRQWASDGGARPTRYRVIRSAVQALAPMDTHAADERDVTSDNPEWAVQDVHAQGGATPLPSASRTTPVRDMTGKGNHEGDREGDPKEDPEEHHQENQKGYGTDEDPIRSELSGDDRRGTQDDASESQWIESMSDLASEPTTEDILLVLEVAFRSEATTPDISVSLSEEGKRRLHILGISPTDEKKLARHFEVHREQLRDLLALLPEEELRHAFEVGLDTYLIEPTVRKIQDRLRASLDEIAGTEYRDETA